MADKYHSFPSAEKDHNLPNMNKPYKPRLSPGVAYTPTKIRKDEYAASGIQTYGQVNYQKKQDKLK